MNGRAFLSAPSGTLLAALGFLCCGIVCLYIVVGLTFSRSPVFNTRDAALFRAPEPQGFVRQKPDAPGLIAFRRHLGDLIQPRASSLETARALRTWSYRQQRHTREMLNGGNGEDSVDPEVLFAQQRRGVPGACRRFAYVYLGSLLSAGLNARVVTWDSSFYDRDTRAHTLVEVWIEELRTWVMMDAMSDHEFLVDGRPASLIDVREAVMRGEPQRVTADHPSFGPVSLTLTPEDLRHIYVSLTNAVFDGYSVSVLTTRPISFLHYVDRVAEPYPQRYKRLLSVVGAGTFLLGAALLGAAAPALLKLLASFATRSQAPPTPCVDWAASSTWDRRQRASVREGAVNREERPMG
jgi:hypothetical protein